MRSLRNFRLRASGLWVGSFEDFDDLKRGVTASRSTRSSRAACPIRSSIQAFESPGPFVCRLLQATAMWLCLIAELSHHAAVLTM